MISYRNQIGYKRGQLSVLPAAVVLTCLVSSTIGFLAILLGMFKAYFESVYLCFMLLIFLVYHIFEASEKVNADYNSIYDVNSFHFGLDLQTWKKLETLMVVYGVILLIIHCMCNESKVADELLQAWWFVILLIFFEAEAGDTNTIHHENIPSVSGNTSWSVTANGVEFGDVSGSSAASRGEDASGSVASGNPYAKSNGQRNSSPGSGNSGDFHNSIFIPILIVLFMFAVKLIVSCPEHLPNELVYRDLMWTFVLWVLAIVFYSIETLVLHEPSQIIRPFHHFFALLLVLASIFTLNSVESAKAKAKKKEERRSSTEGATSSRSGSPPISPSGRRSFGMLPVSSPSNIIGRTPVEDLTQPPEDSPMNITSAGALRNAVIAAAQRIPTSGTEVSGKSTGTTRTSGVLRNNLVENPVLTNNVGGQQQNQLVSATGGQNQMVSTGVAGSGQMVPSSSPSQGSSHKVFSHPVQDTAAVNDGILMNSSHASNASAEPAAFAVRLANTTNAEAKSGTPIGTNRQNSRVSGGTRTNNSLIDDLDNQPTPACSSTAPTGFDPFNSAEAPGAVSAVGYNSPAPKALSNTITSASSSTSKGHISMGHTNMANANYDPLASNLSPSNLPSNPKAAAVANQIQQPSKPSTQQSGQAKPPPTAVNQASMGNQVDMGRDQASIVEQGNTAPSSTSQAIVTSPNQPNSSVLGPNIGGNGVSTPQTVETSIALNPDDSKNQAIVKA